MAATPSPYIRYDLYVMATRGNVGAVGCLALFALPFALVGAGAGVFFVLDVWQWWDARSWTPTPAILEHVHLDTNDSGDSTTYLAEATYRYTLGGQEYTGDRVGFGRSHDNIGSFHQRAARELEQRRASGEPWTAFVDPDDPHSAVLYRGLRWKLLVFKAAFLVLFGGFGFGLLLGLPVARRRLAEDDRFKELHPDEPWLWKDAWRGDTLFCKTRGALFVPLLFAITWNLISLPLVAGTWEEIVSGQRPVLWLVLVFPMVGLFLASWAVRAVVRWRRFGRSQLHLDERPVLRGAPLRGRVVCATSVGGLGEAVRGTTRLSCRDDGRDRDSGSRLLAQEEQPLRGEHVRSTGRGTEIDVALDVPREAPDSAENGISWTLEVRLERRGVDYLAQFDVPVFGVAAPSAARAASRTGPRSTPGTEAAPREGLPAGVWAQKGVLIEPHEGGHHYVFQAARQKGAALALTVFTLIWSGVVVGLFVADVPWFFRVMFSLFEIPLVCGTLDLWLMRREVVAGPQGLAWRSGFVLPGRARSVSADDVLRLAVEKGMQSGDKLFYRVRLERRGKHGDVTLADKLESRNAAADLVSRFQRDLEAC